MPALTKWQLLPDDSPMHFHAAIPYSGRRFGTTPRFFFGGGGWGPVGDQENKSCLIQNAVTGFREKLATKSVPGQVQGGASGGRPAAGHPRPGGATGRFPVGGAPCLKLRKFCNFGPVGLGNFGSRTIRKNISRARPGPGRAQKSFVSKFRVRANPGGPRSISEKVGK